MGIAGSHVGEVEVVDLGSRTLKSYNAVPLVSAIILTYNNIDGIFSTLDSIFRQDYPRIQVIISDDASRGFAEDRKTVEGYIAENAGDNIVEAVINAIPSNVGTVRNTNDALDLVKGDYVISLASEDMLIGEGTLLDYVAFMEAQPELDICFGKLRGVEPDGTYRYELLACDTDYEKLKAFGTQETLNHLFRRNFLPAPAAFIRKTAYERFGRYDEDVRLIEDYPFWIAAALQGARFGYLDAYTVDYMLTGVSSAGVYSEQFISDLWTIYDKYIFPNDRRFGPMQGLYNGLKRWGLSFYMAKARWDDCGLPQKAGTVIRYAPLFAYTTVQRILNDFTNRSGSPS